MYIYILLIYSRAILSFAWLTGYATRPVVLSYTVHTDSFTAHNNNNKRLQAKNLVSAENRYPIILIFLRKKVLKFHSKG